jgi:two-component system cell cycle response regulator DivK
MARRILIVEDSATVRAEIKQALSAEYQCLEAQDGVAGLDAALQLAPDAMIVDIEMPLMNGIELLEAVKKDARTHLIPVVMITTTAGSNYINDCRKRGCAGFLLKPIDSRYLSAKLKQLLRTAPV